MTRGEVERRSLVALPGIPVAIAVIRLGGWTLGITFAVVAALGAREYYRMARAGGAKPLAGVGMVGAAALVLYAALRPEWALWAPGAFAVVLVIALIGLLSAIAHPTAGDRPIESGAVTLFGVVYVGVPLGFAVLLRAAGAEPWLGAILAIFPIAVSWAGDSAAYFGGRRWGRAKLAPHVSPGKTVAGSVCGVVGSIAMGLLIVFLTGLWIPGFPVDYLGAVVLSVAIAVIAQAGDLAESALKRSSGLKDSGSFLPGHGGVLDRFDGVLVALPVTYLVLSTLEMIG